nr:PREDICTED: uncharacterized protein LOC106706837 [Latimeria chalumnae]|eukprot:XP_014353800.1 PREDICTED: uncharacterized protein LOC106706837 [Latimeria chalumnae]
MDGKLFNLSRLRSRTKTTTISVIELQYADDAVVYAHSEADLQVIINVFAEAYRKMGLSLNIQKTKVLHQQAPNEQSPAPVIQIHGETLENVEHFPYLGSHLSQTADIDEEIQHRLKCASAAFGRLRKWVFEDHDIRSETKVMVYQAVMIPTLLYGAEMWTRRHL